MSHPKKSKSHETFQYMFFLGPGWTSAQNQLAISYIFCYCEFLMCIPPLSDIKSNLKIKIKKTKALLRFSIMMASLNKIKSLKSGLSHKCVSDQLKLLWRPKPLPKRWEPTVNTWACSSLMLDYNTDPEEENDGCKNMVLQPTTTDYHYQQGV